MKKLKLNQVERNNLTNKEMNNLKGGAWLCTCSCYWADQGGASIQENAKANALIPGGGHSTEGGNQWGMYADYK